MKKPSCMLAMLTLLVAGTASAAPDTTGADTFSARLAINNQTPFTLQYVGAYVDEHGQPLKKDEVSRRAIAPGSLASIGYGHAKDEQGRKIEGRFSFQIKDTKEYFTLHYLIAKNNDRRTGVKLETPRLQSVTDKGSKVFAIDSYRLVSVDMIKQCNVPQPLAGIESGYNDCIFILSMTPEAAACVADPACNGQQYSRHLNASQRHGLPRLD